jgi:hypothetical protein
MKDSPPKDTFEFIHNKEQYDATMNQFSSSLKVTLDIDAPYHSDE